MVIQSCKSPFIQSRFSSKVLTSRRIASVSALLLVYPRIQKTQKSCQSGSVSLEKRNVNPLSPHQDSADRPDLDGKFWDFTSDLAKGDMAYTTLALGAHTDNTYFASFFLLSYLAASP